MNKVDPESKAYWERKAIKYLDVHHTSGGVFNTKAGYLVIILNDDGTADRTWVDHIIDLDETVVLDRRFKG